MADRPNVVFRDNAALIQLKNLKNKRTAAVITDAVVTAALYAEDGTTAILSPTALAHSANGNYYLQFTPTIPTEDHHGWCQVDIAAPYLANWRFQVDFRTRDEVY